MGGDTADIETSPPTVREVIFKQASPIIKRMFLLYLATAAFLIIYAGALTFLFAPTGGGLFTLALEVYALSIAAYAGVVYLWGRRKLSASLRIHCYALAVLGFSLGGILDAWGGYGFLSLGYWLSQAGNDSPPVCGRDGGEVMVFGPASLVCPKCSKVVRVGYDIPARWVRFGFLLFAVGVAVFVLGSLGAFSNYYLQHAGTVLFIDGLAFLLTFYIQRVYFGGYVRIPPVVQGTSA